MDARSKDYTKSQTILSKKTIVDGTFGRGEYQGGEELFAEKFNNVKFRDFHDNTRLNINNKDYQEQKEKRDRAVKYWKDRVI
jgi:hypothetical protein